MFGTGNEGFFFSTRTYSFITVLFFFWVIITVLLKNAVLTKLGNKFCLFTSVWNKWDYVKEINWFRRKSELNFFFSYFLIRILLYQH